MNKSFKSWFNSVGLSRVARVFDHKQEIDKGLHELQQRQKRIRETAKSRREFIGRIGRPR